MDTITNKINKRMDYLENEIKAFVDKWEEVLIRIYDKNTYCSLKSDPNSSVARFYYECDRLIEIMQEILSDEVEERLRQCDHYIEQIERELLNEKGMGNEVS